MPVERNALALTQKVREHIANFSDSPYRNGFDDDPEKEGCTSILSMLNEAQRQLLDTGYAKCDFFFKIVAGKRDYTVDAWLHQFVDVIFKGVPLERTTIGKLDRENPSWRLAPPGTPQRFYFIADQIGLFPTPAISDGDETDGSLVIKADSTVPDLSAKTDLPKRLPVRFHDLLAIGAALFISVSDTENEAAQRRIGFLASWWKAGKADLKEIIQQRDLDQCDQIEPVEYRQFYRR